MNAAIVTVGDELLMGDTENTNATWLSGRLNERGVSVERVTTVPDRLADIARVVNEYRAEYDAVLVTGGIGPTHDDVTMAGVAAAFGRDLVENAEALDWLTEHGGYAAAELNDGTAALPAGARPLHNGAGVAPGCVLESVYVFPGVPDEMEAMFDGVASEFSGQVTYTEFVAVDEPESTLVDRLGALREAFDVSVGSYPGEHVRVKLTAGERGEAERAAAWLRERVDPVEN
ncbi:competence/damage-inducible protein A [Halorarum halobium]|uniref:competence/damage-inducible protein A n=1 Tax=Halorarum halobium TaxID=3075121 RepID=UPI0028B10B70|nr:molybdopterin-binding protein [Halobaculum sp. XH14]